MKKVILYIFIMCFMVVIGGCGQNNPGKPGPQGSGVEEGSAEKGDRENGDGSEEKNTPEDGKDIDLKELMEAMLGAADNLPSLLHADPAVDKAEIYFASLSTVDYSLIKDFIYESSTDTSNPAPELAIIRVKDEKDVQNVEISLREHIKSRVSMFENYAGQIDEKQMPMLNSSEIFSKDDCVVFIVAENAKEVKEAFNKAADR